MNDLSSKIKAVLQELDKIEVHGRRNVESMVAVMQYLERLAEEVKQQDVHPNEPDR